jgi:hypothetical protein
MPSVPAQLSGAIRGAVTPPADVVRAADELRDRFFNTVKREHRSATAKYALWPEAVTRAAARTLASAPSNVHAIGIGRKDVQGRTESPFAVRVHVVAKAPNKDVPTDLRIPDNVAGIPVDVVVSSPAVLAPLARLQGARIMRAAGRPSQSPQVFSPLIAGVSVGHTNNLNAGTIGYFVRSKVPDDGPDAVLLLTNYHVLADSYNGVSGGPILHPGTADGGHPDLHKVAEFLRGGQVWVSDPVGNLIDAAVATMSVSHSAQIRMLGPVVGRTPATGNLLVCKYGNATGYSEGIVSDTHFAVVVLADEGDPSSWVRFEGQMRIRRTGRDKKKRLPFLAGGDSGSLVVAGHRRDNRLKPLAVGLLFAGSRKGSYGMATPIEVVERELNVELILDNGGNRDE